MALKVFISYSTKDYKTVEHVERLLEESGAEVFVSEHSVSPGSDLGASINDGIRQCDIFILLWSKNSRASEWVAQEIGIATSEGKTIIPVVLKKGLELPAFIKNTKYLAAYENPEKALQWLQQNVYQRAQKQEQMNGLFWLGVGAAILWLVSQK